MTTGCSQDTEGTTYIRNTYYYSVGFTIPQVKQVKFAFDLDRFLFPSSTGWVISATFVLSVPIDSDVTGTMLLTFPFTYTVDTGV